MTYDRENILLGDAGFLFPVPVHDTIWKAGQEENTAWILGEKLGELMTETFLLTIAALVSYRWYKKAREAEEKLKHERSKPF